MATIDETVSAINDLINSDGAVELPGLSLKPVVENFVDTKYGAELAQIADTEEREKLRQQWIDYYMEGDGKAVMELEIANIKASVGAAKDQLKMVGEAAESSVASNAIPAVITVGTATSTANPGYALIENKTKKNQLLAMLKSIGAFLVNALKSMVAILFPIPDMVIALIQLLKTTKQTVNAIPV